MGWLFAVALGLQEGRRSALLRALFPIALGHEASLIAVLILVWLGGSFAAPDTLRGVGAAALIAFGLYKLIKPRSHPHWVGMRVGARDLVAWSFLMSSAHGAGIMLLPVFLAPASVASAHGGDGPSPLGTQLTLFSVGQDLAAAFLHTLVMVIVMAAVALLVYEKLGVAVLRKAWVNQDLVWGGALVAAGVLVILIP